MENLLQEQQKFLYALLFLSKMTKDEPMEPEDAAEIITREGLVLVRRLEEELGYPVQVRVDSPETLRGTNTYNMGGLEHVGLFYDRPVEIVRVPDVDPKYIQDLELLEGPYDNLAALQKKIESLDYLFSIQYGSEPHEAFHDLVWQDIRTRHEDVDEVYTKVEELILQSLILRVKVDEIMEEQEITCLQHRIRARTDGLYHNHENPRVKARKIADVKFALLKTE